MNLRNLLKISGALLLWLTAVGCGGGGAESTPTTAPTVEATTEEAAEEATPTAAPTIAADYPTFADLNVCDLLAKEAVEAAIGALGEDDPKPGDIIGVDGLVPAKACNYVTAEGKKVYIGVAEASPRNIELYDKFVRGTEIEDLGDRAVETVNGATVVKAEGKAILQAGGLRGEPIQALIRTTIEALP